MALLYYFLEFYASYLYKVTIFGYFGLQIVAIVFGIVFPKNDSPTFLRNRRIFTTYISYLNLREYHFPFCFLKVTLRMCLFAIARTQEYLCLLWLEEGLMLLLAR